MKISVLGAFLTAVCYGRAVDSTDEYEYVVIGSGPGGGTLAANLARSGHSVFLIEAGDDQGQNLVERIPAWNVIASEEPEMTWEFFVNHYQNETQARRDNKFTYSLANGSYYYGLDPPADAEPLGIFYPRGATLGGSTEVNAMNFALPPDNDWRYIANLTGDDSWAPESMREYFVELENNAYLPEGVPGHGYQGYISSNQNNVSYVTGRPGLVRLVTEGLRQLEDINVNDTERLTNYLERDMNRLDTQRYEQQGVYRFPLHVDAMRQRSAAGDYVASTLAAKTANGSQLYPLTLSTHSLGSKVLFENCTTGGGKPRAYGVEYQVGKALYSADRRFNASQTGEIRHVKASKEVIVSGGAFNTPQILKLSGVGPREELEALGIPVIADIPAVGHYMQDNYEGGVTVEANIPWANNPLANCTFDPTSTPEEDPCLQTWLDSRTGPYGDGGAPLVLWFRSSVSENNDSDLFMFGAPNAEFRGYYPGYSRAVVPDATFFWSMVKMLPQNTAGTLTLRSTDPRDTSIINFNYFEEGEDQDLQALSEGFEAVMSIFNGMGEPYTPFNVVEPTPGIPVKQAIKDNAFSHHVSGTCRMGPKDDPGYCVDSDFKVQGVDGLRVVDASVFPRPPGGFPAAPTLVISRKAFHAIVSSYN